MTDEFVPCIIYDLVLCDGFGVVPILAIGAKPLRRFIVRDELQALFEQT
jgi:hypothetical protein